MANAQPDKRYDLSRYLTAALQNRPDSPLVSAGNDTETDSYMLAHSVLDIDPKAYDDQAVTDFIRHAQAVALDVVSMINNTDSDTMALMPADAAPMMDDSNLSCAQGLYLIGLMHYLSPYQVLDILKLSKICPAIWAKNGSTAYKEALDAIKSMKAEQLESIVLQNALDNPAAGPERMFAIKAWMPKYRDNAPMPSAPSISIRITIDGQEIDQNAGKRIYDLDDTEQNQS